MKGVARGAGAVVKSPIGFARGVSYALRGMRFVYLQHPKLARYWVFPILITGFALVAVFYSAGTFYDDVGGAVWSLFPESWNDTTGWIGGLLGALRWLIEIVVGILLTLFGLVLVLVLSSVVAAPFNDALSEAVEHIVTGEAAPPFSLSRMLADIARTIRLELLKVLVYLAAPPSRSPRYTSASTTSTGPPPAGTGPFATESPSPAASFLRSQASAPGCRCFCSSLW
ncbi:MAG: EI24 domain-containing protein [Deltaproteobacteria bacterium]|nr:EI24 domain-containing protein [Deltaproteobacteria bacterium]